MRVGRPPDDLPLQVSPAGLIVAGWPRCLARVAGICGVLRGVMTSCNALVWEAMQRTDRNAVLDFIRSGMEAVYPDDYEDRGTAPFGSCDDIVSRCQVRGHRSGVRFGRAYVEDG